MVYKYLRKCYILIKGTTAHRVVDQIRKQKPPKLVKVLGWFFAMYNYLQNVNTNVSNANMNIPKVIMSLKSK